MRSLVFEGQTWLAYEQLRAQDKRLHRNLCRMLKEMLRSDDPATGIGKPEALKHNLSGLWSRRLSQKDRLIYRFDDDAIYIFAIGGHYDRQFD
jgi:toxin YoeB